LPSARGALFKWAPGGDFLRRLWANTRSPIVDRRVAGTDVMSVGAAAVDVMILLHREYRRMLCSQLRETSCQCSILEEWRLVG